MQLSRKTVGPLQVVTTQESRIDASVAIQFKDTMRSLTQGVQGRIILDLNHVGFIDSSGLGAVVAAMKQLEPGQTLELAGLTPTVDKVFRLTRMDSIFTIHDSAESALGDVENAS